MVAPGTNFVNGGVLIGFIPNLGSGSGGVPVGTNLIQSLTLSIHKRFQKSHPRWCSLIQ
jgi:hypothetical protein